MEGLIKDVEYFIHKHGLKNKSRKSRLVHRRMFFYFHLREAGATYQFIADMFQKNHATIIHGIRRYKQLRATNDLLLKLDVAVYEGKVKLKKRTYDLKKDILQSSTIRDLEIIKGRTENNLYKELI